MKRLYLLFYLCVYLFVGRAEREIYHVEVEHPVDKTRSQFSKMSLNDAWLLYRTGVYRLKESTLTIASKNAMWKPVAQDYATHALSEACTNGAGHWFNAEGTPTTSTDASRCVSVSFASGNIRFNTLNSSTRVVCPVGSEYRFVELLVHESDTIQLDCHVTIVDEGNDGLVTSNMPTGAYYHREDATDEDGTTISWSRNDDEPVAQSWFQANVGDRISIEAAIVDKEKCDSVSVLWKSLGKSTYVSGPVVLTESATTKDTKMYTYSVRMIKFLEEGKKKTTTKTYQFFLDVQEAAGEPLVWDGRIPSFSYNFKDEYGDLPQPTKILGDVSSTDRNGEPVNRVSGDWWTVVWGSNLNTVVGEDTATVNQCARNMIKKYDEDFRYIREEMGWPPDIRARKGYKSTIYIFGSGLKNDNTANTEKGGYQSAIWYSDPNTGLSINWPCVWASYYPFSRFRSDADQIFSDGNYQREAMIHEGIHALFADMDGVKNSSWFHEAGNTWLQSAMAVKKSGTYGTPGFLDGAPFLAPFMPIECYSGWLQDGSFGGPQAEGVNLYQSDGKQICTWRKYLGGTQYGNSFPIILGEICGNGSIPWIWRNCKTYVLSGIGDYIGDAAMRDLIVQYRARQALFDIGGWTTGYRKITSDYFGTEMGPEWSPYKVDCGKWKATCYQQVRPNSADGWFAPDVTTGPGWSGANIIPILIDKTTAKIRMEFRPERPVVNGVVGKFSSNPNMRAILCYKTKSGVAYYSQMVTCGELSIDISKAAPANGVIFMVVCNTDYRFTGETQRCTHYDYRIRPVEGVAGFGSKDVRWFFNEQTLTDKNYDPVVNKATGIHEVFEEPSADEHTEASHALSDRLRLISGMVLSGNDIQVNYTDLDPTEVRVRIAGLQGIVEGDGRLSSFGTYRMPNNLRQGLYLLVFSYKGEDLTYKVVVK